MTVDNLITKTPAKSFKGCFFWGFVKYFFWGGGCFIFWLVDWFLDFWWWWWWVLWFFFN